MGYAGIIISIKVAALCLIMPPHSYGAEAFNNGATRTQTLNLLPYQAQRALINTPASSMAYNAAQVDHFDEITMAIRARFEMAIDAASQTAPPEDRQDIGVLFAQNFAEADSFHLIPNRHDSATGLDSITVSRSEVAALFSLPQADEPLLAAHLLQPFRGTDYLIWPQQQTMTIETLSYRSPLTAMVSYGKGQIAHPFTGHVTLSFETFEGQVNLSAGQQAFSLFFRIDDWPNTTPLPLEALLRHGDDDYIASLLLAHTNLPHSAIWGYFRNHENLLTAPFEGHFSNFTLPEN